MKKFFADANEAIFGYGSPLPMCVFRIFVGLLSFINLLILMVVFKDIYTEKGLFPVWMSERYTEGIPRFNLLAGVTDERVTMVVFGLAVVASILTMIGLWTRVASIGLFVLMVTLHHRSGDILHSGDWLLRLWVFAVAVGPSGAALSVDRWLKKRKGTAPAELEEVSLWPQRLVVFQLCILYFNTVWLKWSGDLWRNGTATYYSQHLNEFKRFPIPPFMDTMFVTHIATWGTLIVELSLATLVFSKPLRKWILLAGLGMHGYIEYSMNIPLFQWVIVSAYICHYSGEEILGWWNRKKLAQKFTQEQVENAA
ncbi:MAG: HTTM domain-containing protein [Fimbriimonadaceae bacterium]|nr:HTTM domain-containing protein [Fimbriimonadaceae bacterium]